MVGSSSSPQKVVIILIDNSSDQKELVWIILNVLMQLYKWKWHVVLITAAGQ